MILSAQECHKFASWLEHDIESSKLMIEQLAKLGPSGDIGAKNMKMKMMAKIIVCQELRSIEE
jgi:hypothetical protein